MGSTRTFFDRPFAKIQESLASQLSIAEQMELERLIRRQFYGVESLKHELYAFANKDIPLKDGTLLRLFSNYPRAQHLRGNHTYHAHIVDRKSGKTICEVEVQKKPDRNAAVPVWNSKIDVRRVLNALRQLNVQKVRAATR